MSIVRREGKKKRKQIKAAVATKVGTDGAGSHALQGDVNQTKRETRENNFSRNLNTFNEIVGTATFVFTKTGCCLEISVARLLEKSSPGWLQSALPDAVGELVRVPEDTPLVEVGQVLAFQLVLQNMGPPGRPLSDVFSGKKLRLIPYAFLAAHMLGLEQVMGEARVIYLKAPMQMLRSLSSRRGDFDTLRRAIDLGFSRINAPLKCGVAEQLQAAEIVLRLTGEAGGLLAGDTEELANCHSVQLLHIYRAAVELRCNDVKKHIRKLIARPSVILPILIGIDAAGPDAESLRFGAQRGLDAECAESLLHSATRQGLLRIVEILAGAGQAINALSDVGESPAMLAAANGQLDVLRWLVRQRGDLQMRSRTGLTVVQYAMRNGHGNIVGWLEDPLTHCM